MDPRSEHAVERDALDEKIPWFDPDRTAGRPSDRITSAALTLVVVPALFTLLDALESWVAPRLAQSPT